LKYIYGQEGIKGLFRGLTATLVRDVPQAGLHYSFYKQSMQLLQTSFPALPSYVVSFVSGSGAGVYSTLLTYPFDVVRTRIQLRSSYKNTFHGILLIAREEGWIGLFRGITPRLIKKACTGAITWSSFEALSKMLVSIF
jgi:solute carrier family 25 protein 38